MEVCVETYHVLDAGAVVCLRSFVPDITQLTSIAARQLDRMHELGSLESSGADEQVVIGFYNIRLAVFANHADAVRANTVDRSSLESNVWQGKSGIVIIRDDDTLAAGIVLGSQLLPKVRTIR